MQARSSIRSHPSGSRKKALASGWLAAVATHTALIRPAMRQIALDFFSAREAENLFNISFDDIAVLGSGRNGSCSPVLG